MKRTIVIGDIHGCYLTFKSLMRKVDYTSETDTLILIGDYIDRGPNSYEVVSTLRRMQAQLGRDKVICLRGNHEQMAINYVKNPDPIWFCNGGQETVYSFSRNGREIESYTAWFESLPIYVETPNFIFCHAGLSHPDILDNTPNDLLWGRDWITKYQNRHEKKVIFGHTPKKDEAYMALNGDICIDSGCVFGGKLCAAIICEDHISEFVYAGKENEDEFSGIV